MACGLGLKIGLTPSGGDTAIHPLAPYFHFAEVKSILEDAATTRDELSGFIVSRKTANSGLVWACHDSDPKIFALDPETGSNEGDWTLGTIATDPYLLDNEEMAYYVRDGVNYLYVCSVGDNASARLNVYIHRCVEPDITGVNGTILDGDIETITLEYPDSAQNTETVFVDQLTGDLYLVSKSGATSRLYSLAYAASYVGTQTLTYEGEIWNIPEETAYSGSGATTGRAVGGGIAANGLEILIKNYSTIYYWSRTDNSTSILTMLQGTPTVVPSAGMGRHPDQQPQSECLDFDENGEGYWETSEHSTGSTALNHSIVYYERSSTPVTEISFQDGVDGYTGTRDTYIHDDAADTDYGSALTFIADLDASDKRQGLLKFDISSIPAGSTIVGARLELYINTEGISWDIYRIINKNWVESSTYNTLGGHLTFDDVVASSTADWVTNGSWDTITGAMAMILPIATIQGWLDGTFPNYGWCFEPTNLDGLQIRSRDHGTQSSRPKLVIAYT